MPVYNCERYVGDAIESILKQTMQDWELLICDDNSTDRSLEIIEKYALRDTRIKYFVNKQNSGAAHAKNLLISKSEAQFIALMDADDTCAETRLEEQLDVIIRQQLDACGTNYQTIDEEGNVLERHSNFRGYQQILWSAFNNFSFCNASLVVKRECLLNINGYDKALKTEAEDIDMLFRFLLCHYKIVTIDSFSYRYRRHQQSVSSRLYNTQKANAYNITKVLLEKVLKRECSAEFVRFMKYFHRSDFRVSGDCSVLFSDLCSLVSAVENRVLHSKISDRRVKLDIAQKMLFLSLNYRYHSKFGAAWMVLCTVWFCPTVMRLIINDKWKKLQ